MKYNYVYDDVVIDPPADHKLFSRDRRRNWSLRISLSHVILKIKQILFVKNLHRNE